MPDDLVINPRQISSYAPALASVPPDMNVLLQQGLGAPFRYASASTLVATALASSPLPLMVGGEAVIQGSLSVEGELAAFAGVSATSLGVSGPAEIDGALTMGHQLVATRAYADAGLASLRAWSESAVSGLLTGQRNLLAGLASLNLAIHTWANASVRSLNGRIGDIWLTPDDVIAAGGLTPWAPTIWSARLDGFPTAPTAPSWDASPRLATTAFVHGAFSTLKSYVDQEVREFGSNLVAYAPEAPAFDAGQTFWYDTSSGNLYIRYFDEDQDSIWVYVGGPGAAVPPPEPGVAEWDMTGRAWDDGQSWWE